MIGWRSKGCPESENRPSRRNRCSRSQHLLIAYRIGISQVSVAKTQADIADKNWRTSNEKVVLDLFDKRLAIFEEIRSLIGEVARSGTANHDLLFRYDKATDRVPYFFGEEVQTYIQQVRLHLIDLDLANTMMENMHDPGRQKWVQKRYDNFLAVTGFYQGSAQLFGPYMKAHQKV
jgi:hypothetical protein